MRNIRISNSFLLVLFALAIPLFLVSFAFAEKKTGAPETAEGPVIITDGVIVDVESEEFTIPADVEIIDGDLDVKGGSLKFNNKTRIGVILGKPVVATYGRGIEAKADIVTIFLERGLVISEGNSKLHQSSDKYDIDIETVQIEYDYEKGFARSKNQVKIHYREKAAAGETKPVSEAASEGGRKPILPNINELTVTAGSFLYDVNSRELEASHTIRMEFEDGEISGEMLKGSVKNQKYEFSGGIQGGLRDVTFSADRIELDYANKVAVVSGHIDFQRKDGSRGTAKQIRIGFKEGERSLKLDGVRMSLPPGKKDTSGGGSGGPAGTGTPKGGSP
jgi:hypothetical protein